MTGMRRNVCLQLTFCEGRLFAAHVSLAHGAGTRAVRTQRYPGGLIVDFAEDGRPLGIELLDPANEPVQRINDLLEELGAERVPDEALAPLARQSVRRESGRAG